MEGTEMWPCKRVLMVSGMDDDLEPKRKKRRASWTMVDVQRRPSICEEEGAALLSYLGSTFPLDVIAHKFTISNITIPSSDGTSTSSNICIDACTEELTLPPIDTGDIDIMGADYATGTQVDIPGLHVLYPHRLPHEYETVKAAPFPTESAASFKFVIRNLLADYHSNPKGKHIIEPHTEQRGGTPRQGFRFNPQMKPDDRMAELYAMHIRKRRLDVEDKKSIFVQDLYRYYSRACAEVLTKYFVKIDRTTYLFDGVALFVPGESPEKARERVNSIHIRQTRGLKKKKKSNVKKV